MRADTDVPAGNAIVHACAGDRIDFEPDLRDTDHPWFYWHLRVRGGAGREVTLACHRDDCFTARGVAASIDDGRTWRWLDGEELDGRTWRVLIPGDDCRLSMAMPYARRELDAFAAARPSIRTRVLCRSAGGNEVPLWRCGPDDARYRLLLTARHHCCEMMASYELEGFLDAAPSALPGAAIVAVPFVDHDGVVRGDQGKFRRPRDHNQDYAGASIHAETAAIRERAPGWGPIDVHLDLHCPWIRGTWNEQIYVVGSDLPANASAQRELVATLAEVARGELPFTADDYLPHGEAWNTRTDFSEAMTSARWTATELGTRLSATIEFPYAVVRGRTVTPDHARAFGADLARALGVWLERCDRGGG